MSEGLKPLLKPDEDVPDMIPVRRDQYETFIEDGQVMARVCLHQDETVVLPVDGVDMLLIGAYLGYPALIDTQQMVLIEETDM